MAAAEIGCEISPKIILSAYKNISREVDWIVVEGVGGWLVPLAPGFSVADLAALLKLPVVLTVGMRLGCMDHALLTARSIQATGCQLLGWVANFYNGTYPVDEQNIETLVEYLNAPLLGRLSYQSPLSLNFLADSIDERQLLDNCR